MPHHPTKRYSTSHYSQDTRHHHNRQWSTPGTSERTENWRSRNDNFVRDHPESRFNLKNTERNVNRRFTNTNPSINYHPRSFTRTRERMENCKIPNNDSGSLVILNNTLNSFTTSASPPVIDDGWKPDHLLQEDCLEMFKMILDITKRDQMKSWVIWMSKIIDTHQQLMIEGGT